MYLHEYVIKGVFSLLTLLYVFVTYGDTQARSPLAPYRTEWDACWQMATWYITWHVAICLCVVSLPSRLFKLDLDDHNIPQGPDWRRLTILFLWYLAGVPVAYVMQQPCSVGAPGTWARAFRVFVEGIVAFGLGGVIYGVGRYLCPIPRSRPLVLPFISEKTSSVRAGTDGVV